MIKSTRKIPNVISKKRKKYKVNENILKIRTLANFSKRLKGIRNKDIT